MNRIDERSPEFTLIRALYWAEDGKKHNEMSRILYIREIVSALVRNGWPTPSVMEERSYQEALFHLTHVLSDKIDMPYNDLSSMNNTCCNAHHRKQILKKMLDALRLMERKRFYDPPADDEIRYYLIIKNFIRSIIIFFNAYSYDSVSEDRLNFPSPFTLMRRMEDAAELNSHLSGLLSFVSDMDIRNGSEMKPLMGTKDEEPAVSYKRNMGNEKTKEMHNRFYYAHKFLLALIDLRSSELAFCPPLAEERMAFAHAWKLASVQLSSGVEEGKVNICCEELYRLFLERMQVEKNDIHRHCASIASLILEKLSIDVHWEDLVKQNCSVTNWPIDWERHQVKFRRELAKKCKPFASIKELQDYISSVDRGVYIVNNLYLFLVHLDGDYRRSYSLHGSEDDKFIWEVLHALTLLKHGSRNWNVLEELIISENPEKQDAVVLETEHEFKKEVRSSDKGLGETKNENVKILRAIIADLRFVGDSISKPDDEEIQLMQKIWQNASSSAHFFIAVKAFHQRLHTIEHHILPIATSGESNRTTTSKMRLDIQIAFEKFPDTRRCMFKFLHALRAYKDGLLEKLEDLQRPTQNSS